VDVVWSGTLGVVATPERAKRLDRSAGRLATSR